MKHLIRSGLAALLLTLCACGLAAQDRLPDTPAGRQAQALLETIDQTGEASVRTFVEERMDAQFRSMPMEQHLGVFQRMRQGLRGAAIASVTERSPHQLEMVLVGSGNRYRMLLAVETSPPHLISELRIQPEGAPPPGSAMPPEPASVTLDAQSLAEAVESVARIVEQNYLSPDTAQMIASHLRRQQSAGAYDQLTNAPELAQVLTRDIQAIHADRHLNVRFGPGGPQGGPRRVSPGEGGGPASQGIERVERLEGNVGYLKMSIIPGGPEAFDAVAEALRSLDGTDAMILDLRGVPGGSAQMANFLISHFTPPNVHSLSVYTPATNDTTHRYTLAEVPGPRRTEVPLYVLVDGGSASAGEDIPFVLQNLGRAKIVGERTAGAGRNNQIIPAGNGLMVSVSVTRVYDPRSGREWERVGIQPDIAVPSARALQAAHADALNTILRSTRDPRRRRAVQEALQRMQRNPPAEQAAPLLTSAEAEAVAELDAFLRQAAGEGRLSGAVLLAKNGQPLFQQAYGMADRERGIPNSLDTKFHLGSMNKMFTAVAIAQLVEQGRLSFDDPLAKFLPAFPDPEAAKKIQVKHLLTHTSGLGNIFSPRFMRERPVAVPAMLEVVRENSSLAFEPGTSRQYSNTGFLVLGAIIEQVTGQSYYDYIGENIYRPAGMHDSGHELGSPVANLALGYAPARDGSGLQAMDFPHGGPAGGGYSTLGDLLRFAEALRTHRLLSPEMTRTVLSAKPELGQSTYGYGFGVREAIVGHNGGNPGVYANLDIFLDSGYTSVVLINQDRGGPQPEYENRIRELVRGVQMR